MNAEIMQRQLFIQQIALLAYQVQKGYLLMQGEFKPGDWYELATDQQQAIVTDIEYVLLNPGITSQILYETKYPNEILSGPAQVCLSLLISVVDAVTYSHNIGPQIIDKLQKVAAAVEAKYSEYTPDAVAKWNALTEEERIAEINKLHATASQLQFPEITTTEDAVNEMLAAHEEAKAADEESVTPSQQQGVEQCQ